MKLLSFGKMPEKSNHFIVQLILLSAGCMPQCNSQIQVSTDIYPD